MNKAWIADDLKRSGITKETALAAGIRPVQRGEWATLLGYKSYSGHNLARTASGYYIPYQQVSGENGTGFGRVKLRGALEGAKYLSPKKGFVRHSCHLYFPPEHEIAAKGAKKPLVVVEGEKKGLAMSQELPDACVVAIHGITAWEQAPEWEWVRLHGRDVYICMDADGERNPDVRREELKMYLWMTDKGANVRSMSWPESQGKGVDDYIVAGGNAAELMTGAVRTLEKYSVRPATEIVRALSKVRVSPGVAEIVATEMKQVFGITKAGAMKSLAVDDGKQELTEMPEWGKEWVFLYSLNRFFSLRTKEMVTERAFNLAMGRYSDDTNIGETLLKAKLMPVYSNAIYLPGANDEFEFEGKKCVNLFKMWPGVESGRTEPSPEVVKILLEHARRRFPEDWRILIDFLAWCVQNPGEKLAWVLFIQGVQGDGKTFWSRVMTTIMGPENTKQIELGVIKSSFTSWAEGAVFATMEEIRFSGQNRFEIMDRTKGVFSNKRIQVHKKGVDPYNIPNVTNYLLLTNHKDALPLNDDDRRYAVLFSACQVRGELEDKNYFDRLYSVLGDRDSLLLFFQQWRISEGFAQYQAPSNTKAREEMIEMNKSDLRLFIEEFMEVNISKRNEVTVAEIIDWIDDRLRVSRVSVGRELSRMGYDQRVVFQDGKTQRVWHKRLGF